MQLPKIKKRISDFLINEEGRMSKQSLISMGAFLGGAALGSVLASKSTEAQHSSGSPSYCPDPSNPDTNVEKGCDEGRSGCDDRDPGEGLAWDKDGLKDHKAYNDNGDPIIYGDGKCSNDDKPFHFNGVHFSYTGDVLASQHHHHASHNSY